MNLDPDRRLHLLDMILNHLPVTDEVDLLTLAKKIEAWVTDGVVPKPIEDPDHVFIKGDEDAAIH